MKPVRIGDEWVYTASELRDLLRQLDTEVRSLDAEIHSDEWVGKLSAEFVKRWASWRLAWEDYYRETFSDWASRAWQGLTGGDRVEGYQKQLAQFRAELEGKFGVEPRTPQVPIVEPTGTVLSKGAEDVSRAVERTGRGLMYALLGVGAFVLLTRRKDR